MKNKAFNAAQLEAIMHDKGPAMVLAGPGSGKTTVIVERLRNLIEIRKVPPSSILVITFTRASAIEMQYRFMKITDSSYPEVSFGTFHSVFYQILRSSSSNKDSKIEIASETFKYEVVKDILSSLRGKGIISRDEYEDSLQELPDILAEISRIKNLALRPQDCTDSILIKNCFGEIFNGYNKALSEFGKIDFDDMIERCFRLLSNNPGILSEWQKRYDYILIDEYQDINPLQYKVVRLLGGENPNIFAVGDDDQSIYGFRGSDPGIMLKFSEDFSEYKPKQIGLNTNYRCGKEILESAIKVIDENTVRYKKKLVAGEKNGQGSVIARRYADKKRQGEAIALFLDKHRENLSKIAILCRTNSEAMQIAGVLKVYQIPSNLEDRKKSFILDKGVGLVLDYISFAYNGRNRSDFYKIVNKPMRYISRESADKEIVHEAQVLNFYKGNRERQKKVKEFFRSMDMIAHLRPSLCVRYIRKTIGIDELFPGSRSELDEFSEYACGFDDMKLFLKDVQMRLEREMDRSNVNKKKAASGNRVNILTMHGAKGLEFDIVWLPDLNEGIIPSRNATEICQIEEERRMLYVAMTRAKQALIMSYVTGNKESPRLPCRFLRPIKDLWDTNYGKDQRSSDSSSGRSTSSSNSASSRYRSKASVTFS